MQNKNKEMQKDDNDTQNNYILSSPESDSSSSRSFWPSIFNVPQLSYDAELKLERGNAAYREYGTLLTPDHKLKSNILQGLVQEIVRYKV